MGQTLLKVSPAGTLLFQMSRLSHWLPCLLFEIPEAYATDQERGFLGLRGSLGRANVGQNPEGLGSRVLRLPHSPRKAPSGWGLPLVAVYHR